MKFSDIPNERVTYEELEQRYRLNEDMTPMELC